MSRVRSTTTSTFGSNSTTASSLDARIPGGYQPESPTISSQLSLASRMHERKPEYTKPHTVRIRVGSWNVAAFSGTELDLAGWFIRGKGVSEALSGLSLSKDTEKTEDVTHQEARWSKYHTTIPKGDPGTLPGGDEVGIYALGLQEVVDISSAAEALRPFTNQDPANKFKAAIERALPRGYELVAERQLIGLLLLIYAAPDVLPQISHVSTTSVGTGLMGYMGNKGAVTARIMLGGTTRLVFINSHLSAGTGKEAVERRDWDATQISSRTRFDPIVDDMGISHASEKIGDEDFGFWFGDLNYRLDGIPPEDVRRLLMLHTRNEYDVSSESEAKIDDEIGTSGDPGHGHERAHSSASHSSTSTSPGSLSSVISSITEKFKKGEKDEKDYQPSESENPASLQTTIDSLLPHDELLQHMDSKKMFHDGWREGPITFLPSYKYDRGTVGVFDQSEKKRGPSWCDRILYRTRKARLEYADKVRTEQENEKLDAELKAKGLTPSKDDETLFSYDADADSYDDYDENDDRTGTIEHVVTKEGTEDTIKLEYYITHQRILSSDHKPIDAGFILHYDAVVPELKSKIQAEVARELDKAENEGRPMVTVIVDSQPDTTTPEFDGADFGKLRYDEPKIRTVTIANTGRTPALFGFAIRPGEPPLTTPAWVHLSFNRQPEAVSSRRPADQDTQDWYQSVPQVYCLHPGETCTVDLTAEVASKDLLHELSREEHLEDVLVLRVKGGRDQFLALRAFWQRSSHGSTLERLLRVPEGGVRKLQNQHPEGKWRHRFRLRSPNSEEVAPEAIIPGGSERGVDSERNSEELEVRWSAPREVFRLTEVIEALIERVCAEWSMLGTESPPWRDHSAWPFSRSSWTLIDATTRRAVRCAINEALDNDEPFPSHLPTEPPYGPLSLLHQLEVFAETLITFLHNMNGAIITAEMWKALCAANVLAPGIQVKTVGGSNEDMRAKVLEVVQSCHGGKEHSTSFVLLMSSLARMINEIATSTSAAQQEPKSITRPKGWLIRRLTTEADPASESLVARRSRISRAFAQAFAGVVVHDEVGLGSLDKSRLLGVFLGTEA
jgi:phosphatidylinositol-bisphosphatase